MSGEKDNALCPEGRTLTPRPGRGDAGDLTIGEAADSQNFEALIDHNADVRSRAPLSGSSEH